MAEKKGPVRIAQMMTDMNYGGVEMVVMNYYRHLDHSLYQFDFFALEGSEVPQREEIERLGGRVYLVPRYTHLLSYIREVTRLLKQNQYQIVHSHMNTLSVFSLYAAKKAGVPIRIAHSHSTAGKGETKKNIAKYLLRLFSGVFPTHKFACSQKAGEWLFGKKADFKVIHNAIDIRRFSYDQDVRREMRKALFLEGKFVVGHVGRFCYAKNHAFLIDIFKEIHDRRDDAVLILIGEGELQPDVENKVKRLGLSDCVKFLGVRKDVELLYQAMDVFLLPSRYEGLGMVAVEAQASNLPCIVSKGIPDSARASACMYYVLDNTAASWAETAIQTSAGFNRSTQYEELNKAGFNIIIESKKLEKCYTVLQKDV